MILLYAPYLLQAILIKRLCTCTNVHPFSLTDCVTSNMDAAGKQDWQKAILMLQSYSVEFPPNILLNTPAPYKVAELPPEGFLLHCQSYLKAIQIINLRRRTGLDGNKLTTGTVISGFYHLQMKTVIWKLFASQSCIIKVTFTTSWSE